MYIYSRVIAANLSLGGYGGSSSLFDSNDSPPGHSHLTFFFRAGHKEPGPMLQRKIDILKTEGVFFTSDGKLKNAPKALWLG